MAKLEASKGVMYKNFKIHHWEKTSHGVFVNKVLTEQARRSRLVGYERQLSLLSMTFWEFEMGSETAEIDGSKGVVHKNIKFHLWEKTSHGVFLITF